MGEYIKRKPLIEDISSLSVTLCGNEIFGTLAKHSVVKMIYEQPAADVVEVRHGEWEKFRSHVFGADYRCSECKQYADEGNDGYYDVLTPYCKNCGAIMDGKRKDGAKT